MRKYASGYFVIGVLAILGAVTIVVSVIGGLAIAGNSPSDIRYIGWSIAIGGSIQGLLLIGLSTIGTAILDGSIAQQEANDRIWIFKDLYFKEKKKNYTLENKSPVSKSEEKPTDSLRENHNSQAITLHSSYIGHSIFKHPDGFMFDGKVYTSADEAKKVIFELFKNT